MLRPPFPCVADLTPKSLLEVRVGARGQKPALLGCTLVPAAYRNAVQLVEAGQPTGGLSVTRADEPSLKIYPNWQLSMPDHAGMLQLAATRESMNMSRMPAARSPVTSPLPQGFAS
jgi:hypothetical protein